MSARRRHNQRGSALIFALVMLFILSIGTSVLWQQLHGNLAQHRRSWHHEQAFQLAEAGLETAVAALRVSPGEYQGEADVPLGAGHFSVTVAPGGGPGAYTLESWGRLDNAAYFHDSAGLRARLRLSPEGRILEYAWEPIRRDGP